MLLSDVLAQQKCIDIGKVLHVPMSVVNLRDDSNEAVIEYLLAAIESSKVETNLYVGTIYSVKGLEFDIVHLLGVNGRWFPVNKNDEQRNVYYVGCTRAKRKLVIWESEPAFDDNYSYETEGF